jgi:exodeoxyribonuclease VII small subunit
MADELDIKSLSFEKSLALLEEIVAKLESGRVDLEDSIKIYERGEILRKHCESKLVEAEARIEKITLGANGKPTGVAPLDVE